MRVLHIITLILGMGSGLSLTAQGRGGDSSHLIRLNQVIDSLVVTRNVRMLDRLYAEDFVFTHGTGFIEGKKSWLANVEKSDFTRRQHDSVTVEMHGKVALVKGKLSVDRGKVGERHRYHLHYLRLYRLRRNKWTLISHNTTREWHENR